MPNFPFLISLSYPYRKAAIAESAVLPDFHRLVNYPDYLSKSRSVVSGDTAASGGSKTVGGKKHCVMCGKLRICSASSLIEKGRAAVSGDDGTAHIIPRQNKGLCTACDVTVWVLVSDGVEIKWCKGCKNFRQWAAFGDKGSATKCVRCRERQREKYAMQKNAKQTRHADKIGVTAKSLQRGFSSSSLPPPSSSNQRIGSVEEKEENHFAAARGLTSLMNAAAAL
jgi:Zn-finger nucleic acid-binding protein